MCQNDNTFSASKNYILQYFRVPELVKGPGSLVELSGRVGEVFRERVPDGQ